MPSALDRPTLGRGAVRALLAACLAVSVMAPATGAMAADLPTPPGDITDDAVTNVVDVQCGILMALWEAAGSGAGTKPVCLQVTIAAADINCDGARNVIDVQALIILALKLPYAQDSDWDGDKYLDTCDPDDDGDGDPDVTDCAPKDPAIHHGQADICNGIDDDCSGTVDDCSDADPCTGPDSCNGATCVGGPNQCGSGNGCQVGAEGGCDGCDCESCVCADDPYCCDVQWDAQCVKSCGACGNGCDGGIGCIDTGVPGCQDCGCEGCVCEKNPYCCDVAWDGNCAVSCAVDCGFSCAASDGCLAAGVPGCGGCGCEDCVCDADAFCCAVAWDASCVDQCDVDCGLACDRESGGIGCGEIQGAGCADCPCETCVCQNDPTCCSTLWDAECASLCGGACGFDCTEFGATCGDGACQPSEDCSACPDDCGLCCGNGACDFGETCLSCTDDCGACPVSDGCTESLVTGCAGCACESCVCDVDPFCCTVMWDFSCVSKCDDICGMGCGDEPGGLGCKVNTTEGTGCAGCACEQCVCSVDPLCCSTMWDAHCVALCDDDCAFDCSNPPGDECGDQVCGPDESCASCPSDCPGCCGNGACEVSVGEDCAECPSDCGICQPGNGCVATPGVGGCDDCGCLSCVVGLKGPACLIEWTEACAQACTGTCGYTCEGGSGGAGCYGNPEPGCGGCACETCVCKIDSYCCELAWDSACINFCQSGSCGYDCGTAAPVCGDGVCSTGIETCDGCPADCGDCCGDGICDLTQEDCVDCPVDCAPCQSPRGCDKSTLPAGGAAFCEACVCDLQPYCCTTSWDALCVELCGQCGMGCGGQDGEVGCLENLKGPGCDGCSCEACVCAGNPYCCEVFWDDQCSQACEVECQFACEDPASVCGDGLCTTGEDCTSCFGDCGQCCGDGTCAPDETCGSCPSDCGTLDLDTGLKTCCGNNVCDAPADTCGNCPGDCGQCCGNGVCDSEAGEMCGNCLQDCGPCPNCSPDGCAPGTASGLPNSGASCCGCSCEACVCSASPECCEVFWDAQCVQLCQDCGTTCGGSGGDGCTPTEAPGCGGCACEDYVCGPSGWGMTECCTVSWAPECVFACQDFGTDCGL